MPGWANAMMLKSRKKTGCVFYSPCSPSAFLHGSNVVTVFCEIYFQHQGCKRQIVKGVRVRVSEWGECNTHAHTQCFTACTCDEV
jgi:hypothetical protein